MRVFSKRTALIGTWVLLGHLTFGHVLEAQAGCRKQVLVYLDISKGMDPLGRNPATSAFARTVGALTDLLNTPELIAEQDVIKLRRFGEDLRASEVAQGPEAIRALLADLRQNDQTSSLSNLVLVTKNIHHELTEDAGGFDRQLVIVASDFVHEHALGLRANGYIKHWEEGTAGLLRSGDILFEPDPKVALLFLTSPSYTENLDPVQHAVLDRLTEGLPDSKVATDGLQPAQIAERITTELTLEPEIRTRVENGGRPQLHVEVINPNCRAVSLTSVQARCGSEGDAIALDLPSTPIQLAARGEPKGKIRLEKELAALDCSIGQGIEIVARLAKGVSTTKIESAADRLEVRATNNGIAESSYFRNAMVLYLDMKGQAVTGRLYNFELSRERGSLVAAGAFELPANLGADWKTFLLPIRDPEHLAGGDRAHYQLTITDAIMEDERIEVINDRFEAQVNQVYHAILFLVSLASALTLSGKFKNTFQNQATQLVIGLLPAVVSFLILLYGRTRELTVELTPWSFVHLRWWLLGAFVGYVVFLFARQRHLQQIDRDIETIYEQRRDDGQGKPDLETVQQTVEQIRAITDRGGQKHRLIAWAVGAFVATAVIASLVLGFLRPETVFPQTIVDGTLDVTRL